MNEKITNLLIFAVGAAIGSAVTYTLLKTKFEQMAQDEIEEIRDLYLKKTEELNETVKDDSSEYKVDEYVETLSKLNYEIKEDEDSMEKDRPPYVISPDEFGEIEGYETCSLVYYADKVLADDTDTIIDNIDEVVGTDSLTHFGEFEDDSVFVRNERHECDYEILLDNRRFSDIYK